jgi:hypothetical protein
MSTAKRNKVRDSCYECADKCETCVQNGFKTTRMKDCIKICLVCKAICLACGDMVESLHVKESCKLCAKACQDCYEECAQHNNSACQACASACVSCKKLCLNLASSF